MADTADLHGTPTKTVDILLTEQAAKQPDALFAIFPGVTLTYGQVNERARAMAKGLI